MTAMELAPLVLLALLVLCGLGVAALAHWTRDAPAGPEKLEYPR